MAMTVWRTGAWSLQIVKRSDAAGFEVLPKRWIVERTFAWISRNRRLARDFAEHFRWAGLRLLTLLDQRRDDIRRFEDGGHLGVDALHNAGGLLAGIAIPSHS